MAIIPGTMGIKSWSFEHVITEDGYELCERCAREQGWDVDAEHPDTTTGGYDCTPIFADTEMDRESVCDQCGHVSDLHTILSYDD